MEKRNSKVYMRIIVILNLIIICLSGYIIYSAINKNKKSESKVVEKKNKSLDKENSSFVSKIYNTKDWVYDSEYEKNVSAQSYSVGSNTFYAKDIVVPFINVKSSDVTTANTEIKNVFYDAISKYNEGVSDKTTYVDECDYKRYNNQNYISLILTYGVGATDVVHPSYYTYNINLKTGNKLSYEETYKIAGLDSNIIESKVENAITKVMKEKFSDESFDTYNRESINNYKNSISNNTLKYFLSDNNKLNIIVKLIIPAGSGEFDTIITVE